jgi:prepilin-type N-terminal cleavage/methylation domain-containing protein
VISLARRLRREDAFTLIEMLSAMTVFSIVLASFSMVLSSAIRHSSEVEESTNLQIEARAAVNAIAADLRQVYDGDGNLLTSPIESISGTQINMLSPDRQYPFHLRRVSYRLSSGQLQRATATSTDTDGAPWVIPTLSSYRKLVGSVQNGTVFAFKKADGTTATSPIDVKTVDVTVTVATKNGPTRQYTYKVSITVRGDS